MNTVYIAQSLDGYIADKDGGLAWLEAVPNPDGLDFGFSEFMNSVDALIMGRTTYETVYSFGIPWPYNKPVFVLSTTLKSIPDELAGKVEIVEGNLKSIITSLNQKGFNNFYIDGGRTVQSFLYENLIDKITVTTMPILLGGGSSLFGNLDQSISLELESSEVLLGQLVKSTYRCIPK